MEHHPCRFDDCGNPAMYYLVYGCQDLHIADTTVCRTCLDETKTLYSTKRLRCASCMAPIASGQYQRINTLNNTRIITWNLAGEQVQRVPNPEHMPLVIEGSPKLSGTLLKPPTSSPENLKKLKKRCVPSETMNGKHAVTYDDIPCRWWLTPICPNNASCLLLAICGQGHIRERLLCQRHNDISTLNITCGQFLCPRLRHPTFETHDRNPNRNTLATARRSQRHTTHTLYLRPAAETPLHCPRKPFQQNLPVMPPQCIPWLGVTRELTPGEPI